MKNWERKKLGELSKNKDAIVSGPFGSNLKVSDYKNSGVPILRLQNIGKGYFINRDIKFISEAKAEELKYHSFVSGDIALAKLGIPVGKTCIIPEAYPHGIIVADVVRIRPDKKIVDYKFLEYFLNTDISVSQLTGNISGATRPRVNLSDVRNITLNLPLLPEQQRIVSILDEAFAAIAKAKANAEQNLKNAKELFESYLQAIFENKGDGWEEKKLEDICDLISKGSSPRWQGINYVDKPGVLFVTSENVGENTLLLNERKYVEDKFNIKDSKSILQNGDVLTNIVGASIGRTAIYDLDDVANINQAVCLIRCNKNLLDNEFLMFLLNSPFTKKHLHENEVNNARANLSLSFFRSLLMPLPKIVVQKAIVIEVKAFRAETQKLEAIYQQKIINLEELKKSILQKAFRGELVTKKAVV